MSVGNWINSLLDMERPSLLQLAPFSRQEDTGLSNSGYIALNSSKQANKCIYLSLFLKVDIIYNLLQIIASSPSMQ